MHHAAGLASADTCLWTAVRAILSSSALSFGFNLRLRGTNGSLAVSNYLFPFIWHRLHVEPRGAPARDETVRAHNPHTLGQHTVCTHQLRACSGEGGVL